MTSIKRILIVSSSAVALLIATMTTTASALRSIQINEQSIHVKFAALSFTEPTFGLSVACPMTFRIVFNEEKISKRATEVGNVVEVTVAEASCRNGRARVLTEGLPWVVLYNGFTGTLPEMLTIRDILRKSAFLLELPFGAGNCLYEGEIEGITVVSRGAINEQIAGETRSVRLLRTLTGSCASTGKFRGTGTVVRLRDGLGGVTVRLV